MTHILDHLAPALRALGEALSDKLAGIAVQIGISWLTGGGS